jgi:hypothetical protein
MEWIEANRSGIGWILLWAWIALTIFIFAYNPRSAKIYIANVVLLVGFLYMFFGK